MKLQEFSLVIEKVKAEVEGDLKQLQQIRLPTLQIISNLNPLDKDLFSKNTREIRERLMLPNDDEQVIYLMKLAKPLQNEVELERFMSELEEVKFTNNEGYTQITTVKKGKVTNFDFGAANVPLYVGTSKTFAQRVKTHIGYGSKNTATVFLRNWPCILEGRNSIEFSYYNFGANISSDLLKRIEYEISEQLCPLIGHNRRA